MLHRVSCPPGPAAQRPSRPWVTSASQGSVSGHRGGGAGGRAGGTQTWVSACPCRPGGAPLLTPCLLLEHE